MYSDFVNKVREIYKQPEGFVALHEPRFIGNEKKYVADAIDSTFVSSVGEYVNKVEQMLVQITGAKHAVALVNGTNALHLALVLANVKEGDEVLMQSLTFVATANAISYINAIPHFVDVDEETMGLSPEKLRKHLQEIAEVTQDGCYNKITGNKIAACVPMHTFGMPVHIEALAKLCKEYKIPLVEDAAESIGSYYNNKHTGTFGLLGVFSFNGNKTITSGGGGALITNNTQLALRAKHLSTQAKKPHRWEFDHDEVAYNYRMPNLNAALLCAQLEQLDSFANNKRNIAAQYLDFFKNTNIKFIAEYDKAKSNYWLNAILLNNEQEKLEFLDYTNNNGIMTRPIWKLINEITHFNEFPKGDLTTSKFLEQRIVNIPSSVLVHA
jgi:perosamine synthetase